MLRERTRLHEITDAGKTLVIEWAEDGYIEYTLSEGGVKILGGVVHNPENDARLGARRVLTALPESFRQRLETATRVR